MPRKRSKEPLMSKAAWEQEVPELTEEQRQAQAEILQGLGKSVLSDKAVKEKLRKEKKLADGVITNVEIKLPKQYWFPETPPDELEEL